MKTLFIVLVALASIGCASSNSVTEGDRQLTRQSILATRASLASLDLALGLAALPIDVRPHIETAHAAMRDVQKNSERLEEVHGPPEKPQPYTPINSEAARKQSKDDHSGGGLFETLGGIMKTVFPAGAAALATILGIYADLKRRKWKEAASSTFDAVEEFKSTPKGQRVWEGVDGLKKKLADKHGPKIRALVDSITGRRKELKT